MKVLLTVFLFLLTSCSDTPESKKQVIRRDVGGAVVRIFGKNSFGQTSGGTGFSVTAVSGLRYILTNKHICNLADRRGQLMVEFPGKVRRYKRKIIETSSSHDLCLVESLPTFRRSLSVAQDLSVGERIFVVGHPKLFALTVVEGGYIEEAKILISMSSWITGRPQTVKASFKIDIGTLLSLTPFKSSRFNVYSRGGNSGSPIVNERGRVISVLFAVNPRDVMETYGVPLRYVQEFLRGY